VRSWLKSLVTEPLWAFSLVGGLVFCLYNVSAHQTAPEINVSAAVLDKLVEERELVMGRVLLPAERKALIQNFVDQEILVREAIARRLHLHDGNIRHRLADKMHYLLVGEPEEPQSVELAAFYRRHESRYRSPALYSFEHLFFKADKTDAEIALQQLQSAQVMPGELGEKFWLGDAIDNISAAEVVATFGATFAKRIRGLALYEWQGPYRSSRGWHLVRLQQRQPPEPLPPEILQPRLYADWKAEQRHLIRKQKMAALRAGYQIRFEGHQQ